MSNDVRTLGMDLGIRRSLRWRAFRRGLLVCVLLALFVEFRGVPHLRLSDPGRLHAQDGVDYWGVTGLRQVNSGRLRSAAPLIALLPLERSLVSYASEAASSLFGTITQP